MTLSTRDPQRSFFDVSFLAENLFDERNPYELFRREILPALEAQRDKLEAMYCADNGRPPVDPVLVAGVTLLQFMEKAPGEPTQAFLTEVTTTEAIVSDLEGRERVAQQQEQHGLGRADSGTALRAPSASSPATAHGGPVIRPWLPLPRDSSCLRPLPAIHWQHRRGG